MTRVALLPENSPVTNGWISACEATSAAEALCTVYTENEGFVPGELMGSNLTQLNKASPAAVDAFYDYLHKTCPRLTALFVWGSVRTYLRKDSEPSAGEDAKLSGRGDTIRNYVSEIRICPVCGRAWKYLKRYRVGLMFINVPGKGRLHCEDCIKLSYRQKKKKRGTKNEGQKT